MKNKILLLFPDGVGIRNYLYSDVFETKNDEVVLFHNFDDTTIKKITEITSIKESSKIPKYNETVKEKFFRELICLSRLKSNAKLTKNKSILTNWKTNHKNLKNKLFYKLVEFSAKFISTYNQIESLEKRFQKELRKTDYYKEIKSVLENIKPTLLFCSHQRGLQCATIFAAANDLKIKTTTVIYSWDNLPKARLALRADKYLVWSDNMKEEMKMYYPEINQNKVIVTGTPQFECYDKKENCIPKEQFYKEYDLDVSKKIICFSGDDVLTSPDDPKYLNDLVVELIENKLDNDYQILFRRCPVDISGRYEEVVKKYPKLIKEAPPIWNFEKGSSWTTIYPLREDIKLLVSTAFYCDVVVNVGSTMAFDFAMFQKPCIFINYDQKVKENPNWSVKTIYQFQHFKSMPNKDAVLWWNEKGMITELLKQSFNTQAMNHWKERILSTSQKNTSTAIRKSLNL
ncbi:hypothetical protein [uncultured Flavobacterium sp.]|uniref:hypothetical protein n=1 Tax=uncultured Flavobacterium sp. TaxID=165435 RepID=UPI0030ECDCB9